MWQGKLMPKQEQELATATEEWGKCNTPRGPLLHLPPTLPRHLDNKQASATIHSVASSCGPLFHFLWLHIAI